MSPQPMVSTPGGAPPASGSSGNNSSKLPLILGAIVAVAVAAAAAFFLLGGDDESDGTGEFTASIEGDDGSFVGEIKAKPGDAFGVKVETSSDELDPVLVIAALDDESTKAINDFEADELNSDDPEADHKAVGDLVRSNTNVRIVGEPFGLRDDSGAGDDEGFGLTFPVAGTFSITVAGFSDTEGDVKVTIAKQSTKEDLGDNPSADDIDALTTGEHEDFLSDFTDDPTIFADFGSGDPDPAPDPDPVPDPDPTPDPDPSPDPTFGGGDLESEAIDLLTTELVSSASLSEEDARCVSTNIIETIGVEGLAEIGLAAGPDGEFTDLSDEDQAELFTLITGAFGVCGIAAN